LKLVILGILIKFELFNGFLKIKKFKKLPTTNFKENLDEMKELL